MEKSELESIISRGLSVEETRNLLRDAIKQHPHLSLIELHSDLLAAWIRANQEELFRLSEDEADSRAQLEAQQDSAPLFTPQVTWPEGTEYLSDGPFFDVPAAPRVGLFGRMVKLPRRIRNELRRFGYGEPLGQ